MRYLQYRGFALDAIYEVFGVDNGVYLAKARARGLISQSKFITVSGGADAFDQDF